ncbi:MAG: arylsulfatase [Rikenellaceae bacterium]
MREHLFLAGSLAVSLTGCAAAGSTQSEARPNVIVVLTDDQGIANLSCLGNEYIETPNIDRLYEQSVRMTDFHVSPLSTPTRSAIISGRYPIRNGAWATFKGRDVLSSTSPTIADMFRSGGYSTALFGKWHLGDNYPSRATDRGFDYVVQHASGGVGELSDYWGNSYFDDTYMVNNEPVEFDGYCTDVWFAQAEKYITEQVANDKPFFVYLATNAPHSPHYAPEEYVTPYEPLVEQGIIRDAGYYGQIKNIDDNFGRLDKFLSDNGLAENTIVIFMTDNGAPPHDNPWTMGYTGGKSSPMEGGHRVPFFVRWANGGLSGGVDIDGLASHVDILPTLASLCGVELSDEYILDGIDLSDVLLQRGEIPEDRTVFIHHRQGPEAPFDVDKSVVMQDKWRLISGENLYDVVAERSQESDVATEHSAVVESLRAANDQFIAQTKLLDEYQRFIPVAVIDPAKQSVATLTIQHAMGQDPGLWMPYQIAEGIRNRNNGYEIEIPKDMRCKISLARWPRECPGAIWGVPSENPKAMFEYTSITPESASLKIGSDAAMVKEITKDMYEVNYEVDLKAGRHFIETDFIDDGKPFGAYYIYIEAI